VAKFKISLGGLVLNYYEAIKGSLLLGTTSVSSLRNLRLSTISDYIDPFLHMLDLLDISMLSLRSNSSSSSSLKLRRNLLAFFSSKMLVVFSV
jgi:hypothetical protein